MPTVMADDGFQFDPDEGDLSIFYNEDGTVNYTQVQVAGRTYRQSYSYADGKLTGIGSWRKQ